MDMHACRISVVLMLFLEFLTNDSVLAKISERYRKGKKFSIIVVAEGAYPQGGEMVVQNYVPTSHDPIRLGGIGQKVAEEISAKLKNIEIRVTVLGHLQRGGAPVPFDRVLATRYISGKSFM